MKYLIYLTILIQFFCSATFVKVHNLDRSILLENRKIAIIAIEPEVTSSENPSFLEKTLKDLYIANPNETIEEIEKAIQKNYDNKLENLHKENLKIVRSLENNWITHANSFLVSKGFFPLDRSEIIKILNEQTLYKSGLFDSSENVRIGKLSTANSILVGKLKFHSRGVYIKEVQLTFTAKIISVEEGKILAIGESSVTGSKLTNRLISDVIELWFKNIPNLNSTTIFKI